MGTQRLIRDSTGQAIASENGLTPARARISGRGLADGLTALSSARDDRLGR